MRPTITLQLKIGLLGLCLLFIAFIPRGDDPVDKLITVLQRWTDSIPQEKVYLQTDKPYYVLGDTIWFKGYVTIGSRHQLSALSGSLYVDLINEKDSIIRALKLPITAGMAIGDFVLGDDYKQGSYRIRSYTQWMRNAGDEYFYDHTFTVGDLVSNNIIVKADYGYKQVDGKVTLSAMLNYAGDDGKPLSGKDVHYQVIINKQVVWARSATTDASGNIPVNVPNDKQVSLAGAYIHTTLDGNDKHTIVRDFPIKANLAQSDVQFFPEGGNLVNGIASRVAFKAVGVDGLGIVIKGKVVDETNKAIADITTLHAGMGSFMLKPVPNKRYTANIIFADGTNKAIPLPKVMDEGLVLSINQNNKDSVQVRINASKNLQQSSVGLIAHTNGETQFASTVKLTGVTTSVWLDRKAFPTGIAQFTLFNSNNEPINERIAFIKTNDQLKLNITTAKSTYGSKEHIKVDLSANDGKGKPTIGNFSVAVIDESKVPVDETTESTIFSNLLLTSDLKGYVEKPNYYFVKETEETNKELDNLMLTQGYRRFTWKELNNITDPNTKPQFPVQSLLVDISGTVTNLNDRPLTNATVMMLALKAGVSKVTTTDFYGKFRFTGIFMTDSIKFTIQARNGKSNKLNIILDSIPKMQVTRNRNIPDITTNVSGTLKAYLDNGKKEDDIYEKVGRLDRVHRLREVQIRAKKIEAPSPYAVQGNLSIPEGHADHTIIMKDVDHSSTLANYLQGRIPQVYFTPYPYRKKGLLSNSDIPMDVVLDGILLDHVRALGVFDGTYLDPLDVIKIEAVTTNLALIASVNRKPVLFIYTKSQSTKHISDNLGVVNLTPKGFNKVREFYSPRYDRPGNAASQPDLRTTVYWNPYLKTDETGKTAFNFFNADGPGTYRVVVEGINADGQIGRQVFRYTVDGDRMSSNAGMSGAAALAAASPTVSTDKSLALITAPLDSMNKRLPIEKVYLHTDKPYYNIGDTLWFKSYLLDRVNLTGSHLSGLLYVELDNDSSEMVRRISIPIKEGLGWAQIPLPKTIFHEGGYTLRAYTNWMQNFGEDHVFSQRFYLGVPTTDAWLVRSSSTIERVEDKDQLQVDIKLNRADKLYSPVALRKVKVKLYEGRYFIAEQTLMTGIDGSLKFTERLKEKKDGRNIRAQITSLEDVDRGKVVQVPLVIRRNQNIDLQFLPEGGNLVAGIPSTVGFKALAEDGKGIPVAGSIQDSKGNTITTFAAIHNGMGNLTITPKANEAYTAKIEQPKGTTRVYPLPMISPTGTILHIDNKENSDNLSITLNGLNSLTADSACYLVGTSRGIMYYSKKVETNQAPETAAIVTQNLTVDKKLFPSGIARFTLFKGNRPLNERAVFIDNHDQLTISITPNKSTYNKRDSVSLAIEVKDKSGIPVQGSFSLAVTDDSQVKPDSLNNNGITTSLLLNSELKGHIESPGYYITRKDKQAWQALDNLLLTQGWTGYDWKDVFAVAKLAKFEAEKEFKITGQVTNLFNKPVTNASLLISSQKPSFVTTATTDGEGKFIFNKLPTIDSGSFFIQSNNAKGKKLSFGKVSINKFIAPAVPETLTDPVMPWYVNTDSVEINYVKRVAAKANEENLKLTGNVLKEVKIKDKKVIPGSHSRNGPGRADLVFDEQDIKESAVMNLYQLLRQKLPGLKVVYENGLPTLKLNNYMVIVLIDGGGLPIELNVPPTVEDLTDELSKFQIAQFKGMEVMYSEGNMINYMQPRNYWIAPHFKGKEIAESEDSLRRGLVPEGDEVDPISLRGEVSLVDKDHPPPPYWVYKPLYKPGYLENRVNVKTNKTPEVAVIDITTKGGNGWFRNRAPSTTTYRPLPVMRPQQFYSPKYNVVAKLIEPDYRSTLYWEPNIVTDRNGKAKVWFYTSDLSSNYTINLQGASMDGYSGNSQLKLSEAARPKSK
jgi:hypothetical protein